MIPFLCGPGRVEAKTWKFPLQKGQDAWLKKEQQMKTQ